MPIRCSVLQRPYNIALLRGDSVDVSFELETTYFGIDNACRLLLVLRRGMCVGVISSGGLAG